MSMGKNTPSFVHFKFELCQYFKALEVARNAKTKKTMDCCKAFKFYPFKVSYIYFVIREMDLFSIPLCI